MPSRSATQSIKRLSYAAPIANGIALQPPRQPSQALGEPHLNARNDGECEAIVYITVRWIAIVPQVQPLGLKLAEFQSRVNGLRDKGPS